MNEAKFTKEMVGWLRNYITDYEVETKKSVLYTLSFNKQGQLQTGLNENGEPKRGIHGFEQDILVFEKVQRINNCDTTIIPRVIAEVKYKSVSTHDAIVYSEKANKIRTIYPFVRYGLILGNRKSIPRRVLRLGKDFDFIFIVNYPTQKKERERVVKLFKDEIEASKNLSAILSGRVIKSLHHKLNFCFINGGE